MSQRWSPLSQDVLAKDGALAQWLLLHARQMIEHHTDQLKRWQQTEYTLKQQWPSLVALDAPAASPSTTPRARISESSHESSPRNASVSIASASSAVSPPAAHLSMHSPGSALPVVGASAPLLPPARPPPPARPHPHSSPVAATAGPLTAPASRPPPPPRNKPPLPVGPKPSALGSGAGSNTTSMPVLPTAAAVAPPSAATRPPPPKQPKPPPKPAGGLGAAPASAPPAVAPAPPTAPRPSVAGPSGALVSPRGPPPTLQRATVGGGSVSSLVRPPAPARPAPGAAAPSAAAAPASSAPAPAAAAPAPSPAASEPASTSSAPSAPSAAAVGVSVEKEEAKKDHPSTETPDGVSARALADFDTAEPNCLALHAGDVVTVVLQDPSGWWQAVFKGRKGYVPHTYLQLLPSAHQEGASKPAPKGPGQRAPPGPLKKPVTAEGSSAAKPAASPAPSVSSASASPAPSAASAPSPIPSGGVASLASKFAVATHPNPPPSDRKVGRIQTPFAAVLSQQIAAHPPGAPAPSPAPSAAAPAPATEASAAPSPAPAAAAEPSDQAAAPAAVSETPAPAPSPAPPSPVSASEPAQPAPAPSSEVGEAAAPSAAAPGPAPAPAPEPSLPAESPSPVSLSSQPSATIPSEPETPSLSPAPTSSSSPDQPAVAPEPARPDIPPPSLVGSVEPLSSPVPGAAEPRDLAISPGVEPEPQHTEQHHQEHTGSDGASESPAPAIGSQSSVVHELDRPSSEGVPRSASEASDGVLMPASLQFAVALFDYSSEDAADLILHEGDVVRLLSADKDGWMLGEIAPASNPQPRTRGAFPSNYVDPVQNRLGSTGVPLQVAVTKFEYNGEGGDEKDKGSYLAFPEQVYISIEPQDDPEWLLGNYRGKRGFLPAAYVDVVSASAGSAGSGST